MNKDGKERLKIIPLGGVEEVGKNCTVFEYGKDIIIVDLGFGFPKEKLFGIDWLLPDITYLEKNKRRIRALIITHGHLDHIGGIPYLIKRIGYPPIFATKLTLGLIERKAEEFGLLRKMKLNVINSESTLNFGNFKINFFHVNHNIPDSVGLFIQTPLGNIIHTGDFKFDPSPINEKRAEKEKLKKWGKKGVLLCLSDSTNAEIPGKTISEKTVGKVIESIFKKAKGRIIFTTFSTLISRIQQVIDVSQKYKRKVLLTGKSIKENSQIAIKLGYLKIPKNILINFNDLKKYPDEKITILATGTQGEKGSVMEKISQEKYRGLSIKTNDTIVFSSSIIPGNEIAVYQLIDNLIDRGARIIYQPIFGLGVHSSGHAYQEDLKEMLKLIRPKFFVPIHGEHYLQLQHINLAKSVGIKEKNCFILYNGSILEIENKFSVKLSNSRVSNRLLVVENNRVKFINPNIIKERKKAAESGVCFVTLNKRRNRIHITIDFFGVEIDKENFYLVKERVRKLYQKYRNRKKFKGRIENSLADFLFNKIGERPVVILHICK